jgi:hypothetical protein
MKIIHILLAIFALSTYSSQVDFTQEAKEEHHETL